MEEKKIHEVYTFFKDKIIAGEYQLIRIDECLATIQIHGFTFVIWIRNKAFGVHTFNGSFMNLIFTSEEKDAAWISLKGPADQFMLTKKRAELEALESEIKNS